MSFVDVPVPVILKDTLVPIFLDANCKALWALLISTARVVFKNYVALPLLVGLGVEEQLVRTLSTTTTDSLKVYTFKENGIWPWFRPPMHLWKTTITPLSFTRSPSTAIGELFLINVTFATQRRVKMFLKLGDFFKQRFSRRKTSYI